MKWSWVSKICEMNDLRMMLSEVENICESLVGMKLLDENIE